MKQKTVFLEWRGGSQKDYWLGSISRKVALGFGGDFRWVNMAHKELREPVKGRNCRIIGDA